MPAFFLSVVNSMPAFFLSLFYSNACLLPFSILLQCLLSSFLYSTPVPAFFLVLFYSNACLLLFSILLNACLLLYNYVPAFFSNQVNACLFLSIHPTSLHAWLLCRPAPIFLPSILLYCVS
jgi:hypothetical protein